MTEQNEWLKLKKFPIFQGLTEKYLKKVWLQSDLLSFGEKTILAFPGDTWAQAYFVLSGSLSFQKGNTGDGERTYYAPGEAWGTEYLNDLTSGDGILRGHTPGTALRVNRRVWQEINVHHRREASAKTPRSSLVRKWGFLFPGEELLRLSRTSSWLLLGRISPWVALGVLSAVLGVSWVSGYGGTEGALFLAFLGLSSGIVALLGTMITTWLWGRDLVILTNLSLVFREFKVRTKKSGVSKIPLSQIQSLSIEKKGFFNSLFKIGILKVRTGAFGGEIVFKNLGNPESWELLVNKLRTSILTEDEKDNREALRGLLRKKIGEWEPEKVLRSAEIPKSQRQRKGDWEHKEGLLIIRKHPVLFLANSWWGLLGFFGLVALDIWAFHQGWHPQEVLLSSILGFLIFLSKIGWEYWDWDNDIFSLSPIGITDWDKKPLWFGESKKEAPWGAIQGIAVEKVGWLPLILDYGNVKILTGGADAGMVFEGVKHPELVQTEIFSRREAYWKKKEQREKNQRLEETLEVLEIYDQGKSLGDI